MSVAEKLMLSLAVITGMTIGQLLAVHIWPHLFLHQARLHVTPVNQTKP